MTLGQERAVRELARLQASNPDAFQLVGSPQLADDRLFALISLCLGPMETREGGLELREREEFILIVAPEFPFDYPVLKVAHDRFAGFPHVVWSKTICLYQSKAEWNPADGLYGFFDRLRMWLGKAAINDMDPIEGPLEPPHHITDFSQVPFVIRANAPVPAGESWFGLAELEKRGNRIELVGWNDLRQSWPEDRSPALAIILSKPLPMEFPQIGSEFFRELLKQGLDHYRILEDLALAARLTPEGEPIHLVLGIPMRRASDGSSRLHVAVWTTDSGLSKLLREVLPEESDTDGLRSLRKEIADLLYSIFEDRKIKWCQVLEDRSEIVVRRDVGTPVAWFAGKKVLVLGCGALGSWIAEIIARANPSLVHLVDNSIVKPGLLARQNYRLEDIGTNKAMALADRLEAIIPGNSVEHFGREAHRFVSENPDRIGNYDVVLDCTASAIFQMKIERDWGSFGRRTPVLISMIIDAKAQHCLCVVLGPNSGGGIWDAYVQLKHRLCLEASRRDIVSAFYSERAAKDLFQPEPGCSDPTFSGSTADVSNLASTALNLAVGHITAGDMPIGIAFSAHGQDGRPGTLDVLKLSAAQETQTGQYRVRIVGNVYREARAWVRQNNRVRSRQHETGGLLWGLWDDAIGVIWVFDASGPPPDSLHDPGYFVCGIKGTVEEHERRVGQSRSACGFIGFWHTHPDMVSQQSPTDIGGMAGLVSRIGQNQKRAIMLIFGQTDERATAGVYIYESHSFARSTDLIWSG
jgi:hypothetical protein